MRGARSVGAPRRMATRSAFFLRGERRFAIAGNRDVVTGRRRSDPEKSQPVGSPQHHQPRGGDPRATRTSARRRNRCEVRGSRGS